jgi:hypothetical protein
MSTKSKKPSKSVPARVDEAIRAATPNALIVPTTPSAFGSPLPMTGGVELDMKVTASCVADVMISDLEDSLLGLKQDIDVTLRSLKSDEAKIKKTLEDEAKKQAEGYTNKATKALAAALGDFLGTTYVAKTEAAGLDVERAVVSAKVTLIAKSDVGKDKYRLEFETVDRTFEIPVNAAIKTSLAQLEVLTNQIAEQNRQADEIRRRLADLPRYARKARAEMTRLTLSGQQLTGPLLLAAIDGISQKALPPK